MSIYLISAKEFKERYLGLNLGLRKQNDIPMAKAEIPDIEVPVEFDWRQHNAVTEVKNQVRLN